MSPTRHPPTPNRSGGGASRYGDGAPVHSKRRARHGVPLRNAEDQSGPSASLGAGKPPHSKVASGGGAQDEAGVADADLQRDAVAGDGWNHSLPN